MNKTSIDQLPLSVRAKNVLHRMGIHYANELVVTPLEVVAQQRHAGVKTLDEIKYVIENIDDIIQQITETDSNAEAIDNSVQMSTTSTFTEEQLLEMSTHPIEELGLSPRPFHALYQSGCLTIDKVAQMSEVDFSQLKGTGEKSINEIKNSVLAWIQDNITFEDNFFQNEIDPEIKARIQLAVAEIEPIMHLYWKKLYAILFAERAIEQIRNIGPTEVVKEVLHLPEIQNKFRKFWKAIIPESIISEHELQLKVSKLTLEFTPSILIDEALAAGILMRFHNMIMIARETFLDAFEKYCDPNERATQILQFRLEGETLQDIGDLFELTRERVRQLTVKLVNKFQSLFEDYFSEPYQYFHLAKAEFCRIFPEITEEGYEYISIRYQRGKISLTSETLSEYNGVWKSQLEVFLHEKQAGDDKESVSKTEMVMRVLISNTGTSLTIDEFLKEYYKYVKEHSYPVERLKLNTRTVINHLRNTRGIVFNQENKVRFCGADPKSVLEIIDFTKYKNTVISSELILRDYQDEMEEFDVRDGYELFYLIKSSLDMRREKQLSIRCRRVPIIVLGEASESEQAIRLLKEISPVSYLDYYEAYEERFGVRQGSAQGNTTISNALSAYYTDGQYSINVPVIDERDVQQVIMALREKALWFIDDIEELFNRICKYTSNDAINAAAFRRIGYTLNSSYVYCSAYGTTLNFFEETVFSKDVVDLTTLDRRMINLGMFAAALDKKKKALEYIETAPKVFMSIEKVQAVYNLTIEEIRELQSIMSIFYDTPFFNGRSLWTEISDLPAVQKLQGNDWMLTCIMRQQAAVASLSVAGGIILSLESAALNISKICEWLASIHGKMSIINLEHVFNDTFGTRISTSKLAEKLKSSGSWDKTVTDSMDEYIDSLVDEGLSDMSADDLLREEFF